MDSDHLEVEIKYEIDRDTYDKILRFFSEVTSEPKLQKNVFFDSKDGRLLASGLVLRIRKENGRRFITVKGKSTVSGSVHSREEHEAEIPGSLGTNLDAGFVVSECDLEPCRMLEGKVGALKVVPFVHFQNTRIDIPWSGRTLELDSFEIGGNRFYELEAEADSASISAFEEQLKLLFHSNGWSFSPSSISKFRRACLLNGIHIGHSSNDA
jgi:uncharacterized protein YjbK